MIALRTHKEHISRLEICRRERHLTENYTSHWLFGGIIYLTAVLPEIMSMFAHLGLSHWSRFHTNKANFAVSAVSVLSSIRN